MRSEIEGPEQRYSKADLDARFGSIRWIVWVSTIVVGLLLVWITHTALVRLNEYFAAADGPADIHLWPQSAIWWFLPGLGALALAWEITLQLWALFGDRREANLFGCWSGLGVSLRGSRGPVDFDVRKVLRWMALLLVLPIGILTALALPMHTNLRQDDIRDCGYAFRACSTFPYTAARRMTIVQGFRDRNGKLIRRAGIVIDFNDGRRWSSADDGNFRDSVDPALADFLQGKTKLRYDHAETEADIPRLM
jgi:hypothetical protein